MIDARGMQTKYDFDVAVLIVQSGRGEAVGVGDGCLADADVTKTVDPGGFAPPPRSSTTRPESADGRHDRRAAPADAVFL
jgi:hypothetical protein